MSKEKTEEFTTPSKLNRLFTWEAIKKEEEEYNNLEFVLATQKSWDYTITVTV